MAILKVIALKDGYYDNTFFEKGSVFNMDEADYKPRDKDGNTFKDRKHKDVVCSWVALYDPKIEKELTAEEIAASDDRPPGAGPIAGTLSAKGADAPKPAAAPAPTSAPAAPAAPAAQTAALAAASQSLDVL